MWASVPLKMMVQNGEPWQGLEGKEIYHREVKKLCSHVGTAQRCIARREGA